MTHPSDYAGLEARELEVYSDEEVRALENGEGMGYALLAELTHYPGPKHALELQEALGLETEQVARLGHIYDEMHATAKRLGLELLDRERRLQDAFVRGDTEKAGELTAAIADLEGELRWCHLEAHVRTRQALTEAQIRRYDELRGYVGEERGPARF